MMDIDDYSILPAWVKVEDEDTPISVGRTGENEETGIATTAKEECPVEDILLSDDVNVLGPHLLPMLHAAIRAIRLKTTNANRAYHTHIYQNNPLRSILRVEAHTIRASLKKYVFDRRLPVPCDEYVEPWRTIIESVERAESKALWRFRCVMGIPFSREVGDEVVDRYIRLQEQEREQERGCELISGWDESMDPSTKKCSKQNLTESTLSGFTSNANDDYYDSDSDPDSDYDSDVIMVGSPIKHPTATIYTTNPRSILKRPSVATKIVAANIRPRTVTFATLPTYSPAPDVYVEEEHNSPEPTAEIRCGPPATGAKPNHKAKSKTTISQISAPTPARVPLAPLPIRSTVSARSNQSLVPAPPSGPKLTSPSHYFNRRNAPLSALWAAFQEQENETNVFLSSAKGMATTHVKGEDKSRIGLDGWMENRGKDRAGGIGRYTPILHPPLPAPPAAAAAMINKHNKYKPNTNPIPSFLVSSSELKARAHPSSFTSVTTSPTPPPSPITPIPPPITSLPHIHLHHAQAHLRDRLQIANQNRERRIRLHQQNQAHLDNQEAEPDVDCCDDVGYSTPPLSQEDINIGINKDWDLVEELVFLVAQQ